MTLLPALFRLTVLVCAALPAAKASLIGDVLRIDHYYPHAANLYEAHTTVVAAGTSDLTVLLGAYTVNPEAHAFHVSFNYAAPWTNSAFNGLVISGIDHAVTGVSVTTNFAGWDSSRLTYSADSISARWGGLSFDSSHYFIFTITQQEAVPTPEAAATLWLLAGSLAGAAGLRHRLRFDR